MCDAGGMSRRSDSTARWRAIVRDQVRSGLSVAAYCRRAGVPESSFYAWRRKLRAATTFAEVRVVPGARAAPHAGDTVTVEVGVLEVRLPNGRVIVVRPGFDRQTLRDLVATLETAGAGAAPHGTTADAAYIIRGRREAGV